MVRVREGPSVATGCVRAGLQAVRVGPVLAVVLGVGLGQGRFQGVQVKDVVFGLLTVAAGGEGLGQIGVRFIVWGCNGSGSVGVWCQSSVSLREREGSNRGRPFAARSA
jgi:hypothetical protein